MTPEAGGVANPVVWSERPWEGTTDQPAKKVPRIGGGRRSQAPPIPPGGRGGLPLLLVASSRTYRIADYDGYDGCSYLHIGPW